MAEVALPLGPRGGPHALTAEGSAGRPRGHCPRLREMAMSSAGRRRHTRGEPGVVSPEDDVSTRARSMHGDR